MSGVIYEDMIKPLLKRPMSPVGASRIMKLTVVVIGIICVGLVFLVEKLSGLIQVRESIIERRSTQLVFISFAIMQASD